MSESVKRAGRGPYAKTAAKRAEILRVALAAYAASPGRAPTLKEIAAQAGMSEAGLLHHFASKDELFVAVLRERDAVASQRYDFEDLEATFAYLGETMRTPGLVRLFVEQTAASGDPDHPAAAFMRERTEQVLSILVRRLGPGSEDAARLLLAAAEGLQIQWMRDPSVDLVGLLRLQYEQLRMARADAVVTGAV